MALIMFRRICPITGMRNEKALEVDMDLHTQYKTGTILVQQAYPHLSNSDREFIKTGMTDEVWSTITS